MNSENNHTTHCTPHTLSVCQWNRRPGSVITQAVVNTSSSSYPALITWAAANLSPINTWSCLIKINKINKRETTSQHLHFAVDSFLQSLQTCTRPSFYPPNSTNYRAYRRWARSRLHLWEVTIKNLGLVSDTARCEMWDVHRSNTFL